MKELTRETQNLIGVRLTSQQLSAMERYAAELETWNQTINLTAIREPEMVRIKHFLDSLSAYQAMRGTPMDRVIDVGSGAGFPGLPLKILCPHMKLTLVESVGKKANFCQHIVDTLALDTVSIVKARAEEIGQFDDHREQYDWAVARAVAIMPVLMEFLLPLVKVGGQVLAMKGGSGPAEAHEAEHAIHVLGGHLRQLIPLTLPGVVEERYLVIVDKIAQTPAKYPRHVGIPKKTPLNK